MLMIFRLSSLSATAPDVTQFDWYKFGGKRRVLIENKTHEASIEENDVWGAKPTTRGKYTVLHKDDTSVKFIVDAAAMRSLLTRSKPYKGMVDGVRVSGRAHGTTGGKPSEEIDPNPEAKQRPYEVDAEGRVPDKALLKMIKSADLPGAAGIKFLLKNTLLTGEVYHYFDMSSVYRNITSTDDKQWERQVEDAVLSITPKKYLVGATKYKYEGKLLPCLLIVEN